MDRRAPLPLRAPSGPATLTVDDVHGAIRMVAGGLATSVQLSGVSLAAVDEEACRLRAHLARVGYRIDRSGRPTVAVIVGPLIASNE